MKTTNQVASILGITRPAVLKAIERGRLKASKVGRDWIIEDQSIEDYRAVYLRKPGRK